MTNSSTSTKRTIWQFPWRYTESIMMVVGLMVVGFALQLFVGKVDFQRLSYPLLFVMETSIPINMVIGGGIILFLLFFSFARNSQFYQWFSGVPFSVSLIAGLLILSICMGLIPQMQTLDPHAHDMWTLLGLRQITSCWPFVLVYFVTLLSLGSLIVRRLIRFNWRDYAFYLNHIGLWVLLFASGIGAADLRRYVMYVYEGETEWRVYSSNQDILELPIAIQLNDFILEEYPPKLAVIDRESGDAQPEGRPDYFQIDERFPEGRLGKWDLYIEKYIHQAVRNSDSTYTEVPMPGATPAALVKITDTESGKSFSHWVCGGSIAQLYMMAPLDETYGLVMTQTEPKRFVSDIVVYTEDEKVDSTLLEVNKPMKVGNWMIYQYGYDNVAGKSSSYSSFELVYDPWIPVVYLGIVLFALGSVCLMWSGNKKKKGVTK